MKQYEYMVVYTHEKGTGRICITLNKEIESYEDIESLDEMIKEHNGINAVVMDFKLLRVYTDQ